MKINIQTIPNNEQRYITTGDYWIDSDGTWQIRVSDLGDWKKELLVAIHELAEQAICLSKGIKEEDISAFDIEFEKKLWQAAYSFAQLLMLSAPNPKRKRAFLKR